MTRNNKNAFTMVEMAIPKSLPHRPTELGDSKQCGYGEYRREFC